MKQKKSIPFIQWRFSTVVTLMLLIAIGLSLRVIDLMVLDQPFLAAQGKARALREITQPAFRGMITDRNGSPLAISAIVYAVWINPQEFAPDHQQLTQLSKLLNTKTSVINALSSRYKNTNREFIYLKRDVSPEFSEQNKQLKIPGLYLQQGYKRYYPEGEIAAHVIGFTNVDDQGQEGIELFYNPWLAGEPGKRLVIKDRLGRVISNIKEIKEQKPGQTLNLSIDRYLQFLAFRALQQGVKDNNAVSGSAMLVDVNTGEILAMVNQPSFNPNNRSKESVEAMRNRALTDTFEPGSTIKAFSIASALESGHYRPTSTVDTNPGWMRVGSHLVRDEHRKGIMNLSQILEYSSNVGITKIILSLPNNSLWDLLSRVGFGQLTGVGFPGESAGELARQKANDPFGIATMAFGYGLSATVAQLAEAYTILAREGSKIPLTLLREESPPAAKQVISPRIAKQIVQLLQAVVEANEGTGKAARIPGYTVAGKTGTTKIVGAEGYEAHRHVASFVGMAPASHPRFVVVVVIRDPQGKSYYGGQVAGPVFKNIMEGALHFYNIPPDDMHSLEQKAA